MKLRVYLDTSVFSAYFDARDPMRLRDTRELFAKLDQLDASTSELGREELMRTPDPERRDELTGLIQRVSVFALTDEMHSLAAQYVESGVFTPAMLDDAQHVAAAVLSRHDVLVSWNFRHLVNRRRRARVAELNTLLGLPAIEILAPPEL